MSEFNIKTGTEILHIIINTENIVGAGLQYVSWGIMGLFIVLLSIRFGFSLVHATENQGKFDIGAKWSLFMVIFIALIVPVSGMPTSAHLVRYVASMGSDYADGMVAELKDKIGDKVLPSVDGFMSIPAHNRYQAVKSGAEIMAIADCTVYSFLVPALRKDDFDTYSEEVGSIPHDDIQRLLSSGWNWDNPIQNRFFRIERELSGDSAWTFSRNEVGVKYVVTFAGDDLARRPFGRIPDFRGDGTILKKACGSFSIETAEDLTGSYTDNNLTLDDNGSKYDDSMRIKLAATLKLYLNFLHDRYGLLTEEYSKSLDNFGCQNESVGCEEGGAEEVAAPIDYMQAFFQFSRDGEEGQNYRDKTLNHIFEYYDATSKATKDIIDSDPLTVERKEQIDKITDNWLALGPNYMIVSEVLNSGVIQSYDPMESVLPNYRHLSLVYSYPKNTPSFNGVPVIQSKNSSSKMLEIQVINEVNKDELHIYTEKATRSSSASKFDYSGSYSEDKDFGDSAIEEVCEKVKDLIQWVVGGGNSSALMTLIMFGNGLLVAGASAFTIGAFAGPWGNFLLIIGGALVSFGFMMGIMLPLLPMLHYLYAILGWLWRCLTSIIVLPSWALSNIFQGSNEPGIFVKGISILMGVFLQPMLIVLSFFVSAYMVHLFIAEISTPFFIIIINNTLDGSSWGLVKLFKVIGYAFVWGYVSYQVAIRCFGKIGELTDIVLDEINAGRYGGRMDDANDTSKTFVGVAGRFGGHAGEGAKKTSAKKLMNKFRKKGQIEGKE